MKHISTIEFSKVTEYIYLGTNACCQLHFDKKLLNLGVKADISLEEERLESPWGVDFFLWLPTKDHTAPRISKLEAGVSMMNALKKRRIKMYIHCKNGHGRAPTLVAAYFISQGMGVAGAIKFVKEKRSEVHLNKKQTDILKRFKQNL